MQHKKTAVATAKKQTVVLLFFFSFSFQIAKRLDQDKIAPRNTEQEEKTITRLLFVLRVAPPLFSIDSVGIKSTEVVNVFKKDL